jgi:NADPH:quinone reductase
MKAVIVKNAGNPNVLTIENVKKPDPREGWVLIKVKAFGLNRSELFTRQGYSPNVKFPRILGIECVGEVENCLSNKFKIGQKVAALMGGMGRDFDGGYAEYTLIPEKNVFAFESNLDWTVLGAIPEMFQTVNGSLNDALEIKPEETLLIRGGTSSIGIMSAQLAKTYNIKVISTTRNKVKESFLYEIGVDFVIIDDGKIFEKVKEIYPNGVDKVLELVGTTTLIDSLKCVKRKGTLCMTGILGNQWIMNNFEPMGDIPSTVKLTCYMGGSENITQKSLQEFIYKIETNTIKLCIDKVFPIDEIVAAHEYMENNQSRGKLVVKV